MTDEQLKKIIAAEMEKIDELVMQIINSDPLLKDVKCPEELSERLWAQIDAIDT